MEITKEMIEKELGYEINKFKLEPLYKNGECIGLNVNVEPKGEVEFINITIAIGKSSDFNAEESHMKELVEKYIKAGVHQNKIITTKQPCCVKWSLSRKCIVGENGIESLEFIDDENGNKRLSYENNRLVFMSVKAELTKEDIDEINNSNGIICTDALYGREGFRYGFIPS
jgi:hypothetical protein